MFEVRWRWNVHARALVERMTAGKKGPRAAHPHARAGLARAGLSAGGRLSGDAAPGATSTFPMDHPIVPADQSRIA
jgi:hypothetical protein